MMRLMLVAAVLFFNLALSLNAAVIGYFGTDYREIDPLTGGTTFVAEAGGGTIYNTIFALDQRAQVAYRRSGLFDVTATDLLTGISKTVTLSEAPNALGVFAGRLIGYFGTDYREIDSLTGGTAFVAGAGGGTIYNTIFAIDQRAGIAYRRSGLFDVTTTDLKTGILKTVTLSVAPSALGVFAGRLIGYFGNDYREIDPLTGGTAFVAGAGGGAIFNTIFALDQRAGIAYRRSGLFDVTTTDLKTGISKTVTLSVAPSTLGVNLIPEPTGTMTLEASAPSIDGSPRLLLRAKDLDPAAAAVVQMSTDLSQWSTLFESPPAAARTVFTLDLPATARRRFFRLVQ